MPLGSVGAGFVGAKGALVMSMIAMSIVFLVIIGLMFVMVSTHRVANAMEKKKGAQEAGK